MDDNLQGIEMAIQDHSLDALLELDGQVLVVDPEGRYWVKFVAHRVVPSPERPHGLAYSLTLHGPDNERLVGFDNAHKPPIRKGPGRQEPKTFDHWHSQETIRPYEYADAASLLAAFWTEVDKALREKGIVS